ncbi:MAG: DNA repair protein RadA [Firmicutes bacterium ZCTH02-B6]|nr:MAG: DNA repair protein RadA [Firmicutes bacterium ZCTH02-B6]
MATRAARMRFACQQCGYESPRWLGRCPSCQAWNSLVPQEAAPSTPLPAARAAIRRLSDVDPSLERRSSTGIAELDRVLGGGVVPGSVVLMGGEPGIGKSTLLLQASHSFAQLHGSVLYVCAEESVHQVAMRAARLGVRAELLHVLAESDVDVIVATAEAERPRWLVVDSIQTVAASDVDGPPGSLVQVRESAARLARLARETGIPVLLVGHVNKQGFLAGPKVLEHAVDAVLYLEGERHTQFRTLRAAKNRFGSTHEVGLFEMVDTGLREVPNPSELFLQERVAGQPGTVVAALMEGTRPLLVEVQALVGPAPFGGTPRRQVAGVDYQRAAIVLAVLERRCGLPLHAADVYVNAAGGVRADEPAVDLAVALAVASAHLDRPIDPGTVVFGEVGLTGEVRATRHAERRIQEAAKLGFRRCVMPKANHTGRPVPPGFECAGVATVIEALLTVDAFPLGAGERR